MTRSAEVPSQGARPGERRPAPRAGRTRVRSSKLSEILARRLVQEIAEQGLRPGDRLPVEAAMMEKYGVGRATLREALRLLEVQGLVTIRSGPQGGPTVADLTGEDFANMMTLFLQVRGLTYRELIEARVIVEPIMARLAAERVDPETMEIVETTLDAARRRDIALDELNAAHAAFHEVVADCAGNGVLALFCHALDDIYISRRLALWDKQGALPDAVRAQHEAIGKAIIQGRATRAERLMREHMTELAELSQRAYPWLLDQVVTWDAPVPPG